MPCNDGGPSPTPYDFISCNIKNEIEKAVAPLYNKMHSDSADLKKRNDKLVRVNCNIVRALKKKKIDVTKLGLSKETLKWISEHEKLDKQ